MALYYATVDELAERVENANELAWLTHEENGEVDTALATTFLEKGQDTIHEHVSPRYGTPPYDVSGNEATETWFREITLDLALIYLEIDNRQISEARQLHWEDIMARLRAIRDGDADVPGLDPDDSDDVSTSVTYGTRDSTADVGDDIFIINRKAFSGC